MVLLELAHNKLKLVVGMVINYRFLESDEEDELYEEVEDYTEWTTGWETDYVVSVYPPPRTIHLIEAPDTLQQHSQFNYMVYVQSLPGILVSTS